MNDTEQVAGMNPNAEVRFDAIGIAWGLLRERMGTWVAAILILIVAVWGVQAPFTVWWFRELQAAQRSTAMPTKLIRTCQAEIASGGVLMATRMRKTIRNAIIDMMTADTRQYTSQASRSASFTRRAADSRGRKKMRKASM